MIGAIMYAENKLYLSIREVSELVGMHPNTIRRAIKNGKISSIRMGEGKNASYRIPRSELDRLAVVDLKKIFELN